MSFYQEGKIIEVYSENFTDEIRKISETIEEFSYISMDTEFPGIVFPLSPNSQYSSKNINKFLTNPLLNPGCKSENKTTPVIDSNYRNIKYNVDNLKVIQIGLTLTNEDGVVPDDVSTWQFNFKFDLDHDTHLNESINLLEMAGINFKNFKDNGIDIEYFAEILTTSGIVLNDDIKWIIFHGSYDLAYLIKLLSNQPLPEEEMGFNELLSLYFPTFYDVRHLTKNISWIKGSLSKIASDLEIPRIGMTHQAGSDSLVTAKVFHKLMNNLNLYGEKNKLVGFTYKNIEEYDQYNNFTAGGFANYSPFSGVSVSVPVPVSVPQVNSSLATGNIDNSTKVSQIQMNKSMANSSANYAPMYGFQNMSTFNGFNNFGGGNIPMSNMQGVNGINPMYYTMNGYNSIYPQQMEFNNYYGNFYNGNTNNSNCASGSKVKNNNIITNGK